LLEENLDISHYIPVSFYTAFYQRFGRKQKYSLDAFLSALLLQKIIGIPTDRLLIFILKASQELHDFCGFEKVPDPSKLTRFKQNFMPQLEQLFNSLVDVTEPLCRKIDKKLAATIAFDTSGIEANVTENNPKYMNTLLRKLKAFYKNKPDVDVYKMVYSLMPPHAVANFDVKQLQINGHFCYALKFALITNGLGVPRHIAFADNEFKRNHPEIPVEKKSDSPDEDKSIGDGRLLKPVLSDYFKAHSRFAYDTFLGDSAFDSIGTYPFLLNECKFKKALIPLNPRNSSSLPEPGFDEYGRPLCPCDDSLVMKYAGITQGKNRSVRYKWICPYTKYINRKFVCFCENPCSPSLSGRMVYTYSHKSLRIYPGILRDSQEWETLYKKRANIEKSINTLKESMCAGIRKTYNSQTIKADVFLAGIAQLFTVILADRIDRTDCIRSIRRLVA
jgi:transposase